MLPVFYHIPKNAGTYVSDWFIVAFRHYWNKLIDVEQITWYPNKLVKLGFKTEQEYVKSVFEKRNSIMCLHVLENNTIIAKLIIADSYNFCKNNFSQNKANTLTEKNIGIRDITLDLLDNIFLFGVVIEATGIKCRDKILKLISKYSLFEFLILRDPFSRAQSMYNYNTSEQSKHDIQHGKIHAKTFEDYILSTQFENGWLIKNILNVKDNEPMNEQLFNSAVKILKTFSVHDIKDTDYAIQKAFNVCYNLDIKTLALDSWDTATKNSTKEEKIKLEELSIQAQKTYKERAFWDQKLYDTLIRG